MWRTASPDIKQPYLSKVEANRRENEEAWENWKSTAAEWERRTFEVKDRWCKLNPFEGWIVPDDLGGEEVPVLAPAFTVETGASGGVGGR
jgi:lysine-specific histone demethylase 1